MAATHIFLGLDQGLKHPEEIQTDPYGSQNDPDPFF